MGDTRKPRVKDFPLFELENIAASVLLESPSCINGCRVDIERLIYLKDYVLDSFAFLKSKYDTLAFTLVGTKRIFIDSELLDNPRQEKRYRFTIAEEFGHSLIHGEVYSDCKTLEDRIHKEKSFTGIELRNMEANAKALASAILMPKDLFDERTLSYLDKLKHISALPALEKLSVHLSHDFDVNPRAILRRLKNHGFHNRANLPL